MSTAGIVGAGAWGTALALLAHRAGHSVHLLARSESRAREIEAAHENSRIPGVGLPCKIATVSDAAALAGCDLLIVATPAQATRSSLEPFRTYAGPVILCAKGIEQSTGHFMTRVATEVMPHASLLVLSGPSFARDVARGLPTAVTLAAHDLKLAKTWASALSLPAFRIYSSDDPIGVEIGGAVKNVLAIACGIAEGKKLGDSTRAALTTRAFAELTRFGRALGAHAETLTGLSGLGDLLLTCASRQSRNFSFGIALGEGASVAGAMVKTGGTVEGATTAAVVARIAREQNIDMPISLAVDAIIAQTSTCDAEIARLLARPVKPELHRG
ncbi:MAG: NAD(P)H-dependent glycerol-3-phosphate dehydrogenase [Parvibaculaceae bacterium]